MVGLPLATKVNAPEDASCKMLLELFIKRTVCVPVIAAIFVAEL
jgi:hypothetical protein